jgi:drug/metabolite transporter, DME family
MGLGELYALSAAIVWAIAVIMFTRIGNKLPAFELNLIKNTIGGTLVAITALLIEQLNLPQMSIQDWLIMIFSGVMGIAVADTLYMKALNTIGASNTGIIGAMYSPFVVITSIIYLDESLSLLQFAGLLSVLGGVIIISADKANLQLSGPDNWRGIGYGISSVFLTAFCVVIVKPIIEEQPFFWSTSLRLLAGVIGMLGYLAIKGRLTSTLVIIRKPQQWPAIIVSSILAAYIAMIFFLAGYKYTDASIAAILNETTAIFIVFFAWLFLKEKINLKKILGIGLAIIGVCLVVLF